MKIMAVKKDFYEILTLQEIKNFLRISGSFEDELLINLKDSAITFAENYLEAEILLKEFEIVGNFTGIIILQTPLLCVNSLTSKGCDISYKLIKNRLMPDLKVGEEFTLNYTSGMLEEEIKSDFKLALLHHILSLYDLRESGGKVPFFTSQVYERYKKIKL